MARVAEDPTIMHFDPSIQTSLLANDKVICSGCKQDKPDCTCLSCFICGEEFHYHHSATFVIGRHHCRSCFRAVCAECREEEKVRWNPLFSFDKNTKDKVKYCRRCAPLKALGTILKHELYDDSNKANIWRSSGAKRGLMLLFDAMPCPRRCIDVDRCSTMTNELGCPACGLPTVPMTPFIEKVPKLSFDPESERYQKILDAEMRQDRILEKRFEPGPNYEKLQKLEDAYFSNLELPQSIQHQKQGLASVRFTSYANLPTTPPSKTDVPLSITNGEYRDLVFACYCASLCYEYNRFPRLMLNATDSPVAKLIRPLEVHASFTIFECSGDRIIIAFPGTHDVRTVMNDLNAGRVFVSEKKMINGGIREDKNADQAEENNNDDVDYDGDKRIPTTVNEGISQIFGYKVHAGFLRAATLLEQRLPSTRIRQFIKNNKRVIITGHSLGSSLGTLSTLRVLRQYPELAANFNDTDRPLVQFIGFGPPLVGNTAFKNRIHRSGFAHLFLHVVHHCDIVPRMLTVRRAQEEVIESVKNKVEEVKNKVSQQVTEVKKQLSDVQNKVAEASVRVAEAGSNLVKSISNFFSKKKEEPPAPTQSTTQTRTATPERIQEEKGKEKKEHVKTPPPSPSLGGILTPDASLGGAGNNSFTSGDFSLEKSLSAKREIAVSTIETVRAIDLDDDDIHECFTGVDEDEFDEFVGAPPAPLPSTTNKHKDSSTNFASPIYNNAPTPKKHAKKVKSPFDTFGRYIFLKPTREALHVSSSPSASRAMTMEHIDSVGGGLDGTPVEVKEKDYEPTVMRTPCLLVDDPAESFGVLRKTTAGWMQSVDDHWLDWYQRALLMSCFKG